jgi:hypothetical protein
MVIDRLGLSTEPVALDFALGELVHLRDYRSVWSPQWNSDGKTSGAPAASDGRASDPSPRSPCCGDDIEESLLKRPAHLTSVVSGRADAAGHEVP